MTSCSYAQKKAQADRLIRAAALAVQPGTATGSYSQTISASGLSLPPGFPKAVSNVGLELSMDFRRNRAAIVNEPSPVPPHPATTQGVSALLKELAGVGGASAVSPPPASVFAGWSVYLQQRSNATPGTAAATQAWFQLDFAQMDLFAAQGVLHSPTPVTMVNPDLLVRLLAGTLSGSVADLGPTVLEGVSTTHYRMNLDLSKAVSNLGLSDSDQQAVVNLFRADNVTDTTFYDCQAWLDASGRPRRLVVNMVQHPDSRDTYHITYTVSISSYGTPVRIALPNPDNTNGVSSVNQLLGELGGGGASL